MRAHHRQIEAVLHIEGATRTQDTRALFSVDERNVDDGFCRAQPPTNNERERENRLHIHQVHEYL